MSHAPQRADRLLIKPTAGTRPASPRSHRQIIPKAHQKRPVPGRVTCGTTNTRQATAPDRPTRQVSQMLKARRTLAGDGRALQLDDDHVDEVVTDVLERVWRKRL